LLRLGAQARLRPSLIPLFPRDIKDEKADMEIIQTIDIWWNDFKNSK